MDLINGFGWASPSFGSDPPTGSGQDQGSLHQLTTLLSLNNGFEELLVGIDPL